jgi:two-component system, OmpR family, response regulator
MVQMDRLALIDDDEELRKLAAAHLRDNGFELAEFNCAAALLGAWAPGRYALFVVDIVMPGEDGLSLLRRLRERGEQAPVLMLSARSDETDRVVGLEIGADDYLSKPFSPRELVARVRALLRRSRMAPQHGQGRSISRIRFGPWTLDTVARQLEQEGQPVLSLSGIEYKLLSFFLEQPGRVFSRDEISEALRGHEADPSDRSIDLLMSKLRRKLGDDARQQQWIKTVRGEGYVLSTRVSQEG